MFFFHAVYEEGGTYFGAKARINVWRPQIQQDNEFSLAQIWIVSGTSGEDIETVEVGWLVDPLLYGDNRTRLFTYWTADGYEETGCFNLLCEGFVQTSSKLALGATIYPLSGYGGSQYDITPLVWKDPGDGNWWLQIEDQVLGYWPFSLFSHLKDSATMIEWGGEIVDSRTGGQHTTTVMGSGHFPREGFRKKLVTSEIFRLSMDSTSSWSLHNLPLSPPNPVAMISDQTTVENGKPTFTTGVLVEALVAHDLSHHKNIKRLLNRSQIESRGTDIN
ncbi:hypothetical protein OIU85_002001 [Salix viminalis]|uniref:Neprosin PEP catalytic domain-containing protein n=1 Tax=Salix viminalis TaxID=40686 RepID=A0A9Q0VQ02_SALVM|nr:hypothetical protein OIU85_002001 [Salix viminalis]